MREPDFHGLRDDAGRAARQPEFATLRRRAARLRTRRQALLACGATMLVLVLGVGGVTAARSIDQHRPPPGHPLPSTGGPSPSPTQSARQAAVRWAAGGDADHLYALVADCPTNCSEKLVASTDGGRSWQPRSGALTGATAGTRFPALSVLGPSLLTDSQLSNSPTGAGPLPGPRWVSGDGGSTWRKVGWSATPFPAAPPGGAVVDGDAIGAPREHGAQSRLQVLDPATGRAGPLAQEPPLVRYALVQSPQSAGVWVQGFDRTTRKPAVAVSRDGGATWTAGVFGGEPRANTDGGNLAVRRPAIATADGQTGYAFILKSQRVYRTTDGGRTWQQASPNGSVIKTNLTYSGAFVTADGSHVLPTGIALRELLASRDGGRYTPLEITGLPALAATPSAVGKGRYLSYARERLYLSDDGVHWRLVPVPVPVS